MTTLLDELTTGPLAAELAPLTSSLDYEGVAIVLNRKDIQSKKSITSHDIKAFFSAYGYRIPIMDSTALACREATVNLADFDSFDMSNPLYEAKLTSILQGLVDEPLIPDFQQPHMDYVLSLGDALISRAEQIGLGIITAGDVQAAIGAE